MGNSKEQFDILITLRTALLGAVTGWLAHSRLGMSAESATAVAAVVGGIYDLLAFFAKGWLVREGILKLTLLVLGTAALGVNSFADDLRFSGLYNIRSRSTQMVVIQPKKHFDDVLRIKGLSADVAWYAAAGGGDLSGGLVGYFRLPIAQQTELLVGPALSLDSKFKPHFGGVFIGVALRP